MAELASDLGRDLADLNAEIAKARRKIAAGEPVDLSLVPARLNELLTMAGGAQHGLGEAPLMALMAECDQLVHDIENQCSHLSGELRRERTRRAIAKAYNSAASAPASPPARSSLSTPAPHRNRGQ